MLLMLSMYVLLPSFLTFPSPPLRCLTSSPSQASERG
jgi:hypothetical protein